MMNNTDIKIKKEPIIYNILITITLFILCILFNFNYLPKISYANGFDYISNSSYNNTATIKTESEYYYNQIDNNFSYYQLNNNILNLSNYRIGNINTNGIWTTLSGTINYNNDNGSFSYSNSNWKGPGFNMYMQSGYTYILTINITGGSDYAFMGFYRQDSNNTNKYHNIVTDWGNKYIFNCTITANYLWLFEHNGTSNSTISYNNAQVIKYLTSDNNKNDDFRKYTGLNNYNNVNFYGRLYDIEPNTQYTLFTGSSGNNSNSLANVYLSKNCSSANLNSCSFNTEISNITYNSNNGSYTFTTPNYNDSKGVYYLISDKANNGSFPTITGNMTLYKGKLNNSKSYYQQKEKNYYIKTTIENIQKNTTNNYLFSGRSIYNVTNNVALIKFELTRYNMNGISTTYNYNLLTNESVTSNGYYTFNIPNLFDLNINEKGNISGSIPSIKFNNTEDYSSSVLQVRKPMLYATWTLNSQYLGNAIGLVGESLFKGFYNSYGMQGNLYNDDLVLTSNFEFKNRYFNWNQFTTNMIVEGENSNQFGFFVASIGVKNTLTDNGQITPPNSSGFGNSNYEIYNTCEGNIFEDFGCYVSNAVTWTIFNIPIIGPIIGFISNLVTLMYNLVTALTWYQNLGILFGIFILIMFLKILSILWKGKDE